MKQSFNDIIKSSNCASLITTLGAHTNKNKNIYEISNGFLITISHNKIFKELIDFIIHNTKPRHFGVYIQNMCELVRGRIDHRF